MSPPSPAALAAASSPAPAPPPPPLFPRNGNTKNGAILSGAAFLRRAASAGLVSVVVKSPTPAPPLLFPCAPSASSVFSSSSSFFDDSPPVSAFLPIAGLPAASGLLRALSGEQSLPPQVELR